MRKPNNEDFVRNDNVKQGNASFVPTLVEKMNAASIDMSSSTLSMTSLEDDDEQEDFLSIFRNTKMKDIDDKNDAELDGDDSVTGTFDSNDSTLSGRSLWETLLESDKMNDYLNWKNLNAALPKVIMNVENDDTATTGVVVDDGDDLSFAPLADNDDIDEQRINNDEDISQFCPSDEEFECNSVHECQTKNNHRRNEIFDIDILQKQQPGERTGSETNEKHVHVFNEDNFAQPKKLPGSNNMYKVVCVSFLEYNVATSVACKVLDESFRMLRPGGLLYVIDKGGCTVQKHPTMRQWLTRIRDPTVKHLVHEIETRAILQVNGFVHTTLDENNTNSNDGLNNDWDSDEIARWMGIKS
jgi:hypothetical protein